MSHKIEFIVTDLGRQSDPFILHLFAALAEKERTLISTRTKAALAATRARGTKLGMAARTRLEIRRLSAQGAVANATAAMERLKPLDWTIRAALADGVSLRKAADLLNERGMASLAGGMPLLS